MICLRKAKGELNALVIKREYTRNVLHFSQQPAAGPSKQVYFDLLFGLEYYAAGASYPSKNTPLNCFEMGASLSARVTAELSRDKILTLRAARLGACSMHYEPLGPATWRTTDTRSPAQYRAIARGTLCPLCEGAPADPFHVLCVCPHPVAASARTAALARATTYIPTLAKHIYSATPDPSEELTATYEELTGSLPLAARSSTAFPWLSPGPRPAWTTPTPTTRACWAGSWTSQWPRTLPCTPLPTRGWPGAPSHCSGCARREG